MNTGTMIANAIPAGKSFKIRTTGKGFSQALAQLRASLQGEGSPDVEAPLKQEQSAYGNTEAASRVRYMYLSGKDRAVRVIKL